MWGRSCGKEVAKMDAWWRKEVWEGANEPWRGSQIVLWTRRQVWITALRLAPLQQCQVLDADRNKLEENVIICSQPDFRDRMGCRWLCLFAVIGVNPNVIASGNYSIDLITCIYGKVCYDAILISRNITCNLKFLHLKHFCLTNVSHLLRCIIN